MIKKLRKIALVLSIAAVLFATGPEVWSQAANAQAILIGSPAPIERAMIKPPIWFKQLRLKG